MTLLLTHMNQQKGKIILLFPINYLYQKNKRELCI